MTSHQGGATIATVLCRQDSADSADLKQVKIETETAAEILTIITLQDKMCLQNQLLRLLTQT